jgi:hypothetical protein
MLAIAATACAPAQDKTDSDAGTRKDGGMEVGQAGSDSHGGAPGVPQPMAAGRQGPAGGQGAPGPQGGQGTQAPGSQGGQGAPGPQPGNPSRASVTFHLKGVQ